MQHILTDVAAEESGEDNAPGSTVEQDEKKEGNQPAIQD